MYLKLGISKEKCGGQNFSNFKSMKKLKYPELNVSNEKCGIFSSFKFMKKVRIMEDRT